MQGNMSLEHSRSDEAATPFEPVSAAHVSQLFDPLENDRFLEDTMPLLPAYRPERL